MTPVGTAQHVVVEAVLLVPQVLGVHRVRDECEVLHELDDEVVERRGALCEFAGDLQHVEAVEGHPSRRVGLLQYEALGHVRAVYRADVVQAKEAALEQVRPLGVLPVHPPGEVQGEAWRTPE